MTWHASLALEEGMEGVWASLTSEMCCDGVTSSASQSQEVGTNERQYSNSSYHLSPVSGISDFLESNPHEKRHARALDAVLMACQAC